MCKAMLTERCTLDIDDGSTVMDYMQAERERGITINSAAITFGWQGHRINLIDTPGHVDFTIEVERAVRVLDGAVTILDGVAGVEAQTETVWRQADRYDIPRIAFVNKMDRMGAAYGRTVKEIWKKLRARPLVLQIPLIRPETDEANGIYAVADLLEMQVLSWEKAADGSQITRKPLDEAYGDAALLEEARKGRAALIEALAELDDGIVEVFFDEADGDHMRVRAEAIKAALRRVTLANKAVPVLCGSAYRNIGIQPLLDAMVDYLPSPLDRPAALATFKNGQTALVPLAENGKLCAFAFKVTHDARRGPLVYVKVYSGKHAFLHYSCFFEVRPFTENYIGKINNRMGLYNTTTGRKERVNKLLQMYAKDVEEIPCITTGNIGVIVGLKDTRTGDTLVQSNDTVAIKSNMQLGSIEIPSPAFFSAIEPASTSDQPAVEEALKHLTREDPSLKVWTDEDSGQMLISGMGELHLEIVRDRLVNEFKCKADMGKIRIGYRETCQAEASVSSSYDREIMGKRLRAKCRVDISPLSEEEEDDSEEGEGWISESGNRLWIDVDSSTIHDEQQQPDDEEGKEEDEEESPDPSSAATATAPEAAVVTLKKADVRQAMHTGLSNGLARGSILGFPLTKVKVKVYDLETFGPETTLAAITTCVFKGVQAAIQQASPCLLEPMMEVQTEVSDNYIGPVVSDLSGKRRGHVLGLEAGNNDDSEEASGVDDNVQVYAPRDSLLVNGEVEDGYNRVKQIVKAHVPLSSMLGYSTALRSLTGGSGTFSMRVIGYGEMSKDRERAVINEIRGTE